MSISSLAAEPSAVALPDVILVIDDDPSLAQQIVHHLCLDGYQALPAQSTNHARMLAAQHPLAAIVLGALENPRSSLDTLDEIRSASAPGSPWDPTVPVLVVSARTEELDLARAFEAGADDFMARPARYIELRARLRAVLHRAHPNGAASRRLSVGALEIDVTAHEVSVGGHSISLRRKEYELLKHLAAEPERVFTKAELLRAVWGLHATSTTRTVDSHASRLRRKLAANSDRRWITNVWGVGFRLK